MTVPRMKMMQNTVFVQLGIMQLQSPNKNCTSSLGPRSPKMLGRGRLRGLLRSKKPATSPLMSTCASVRLSAASCIRICGHAPQGKSQPGLCAAARRSHAPQYRYTKMWGAKAKCCRLQLIRPQCTPLPMLHELAQRTRAVHAVCSPVSVLSVQL